MAFRQLLLLLSLCVATSSANTPLSKSKNGNSTTWFSGYWNGDSSTRSSFQQQVERTKRNLESELARSKLELEKEAQRLKKDLRSDVKRMKRLVIQSMNRNVFGQRVGWERFRHSVRDFVGLALGTIVVFKGYSLPQLRNGGSCALQTAQVGWELALLIDLPGSPWLQDAVSGAIGLVAWRLQFTEQLSTVLPPAFLVMAVFRTLKNVMEDIFYDVQHFPVNAVSGLASLLALIVTPACGIPVEMAAASISGARLVLDSVGAEIAGNWLYMIEDFVWYVLPVVGKVLGLVLRVFALVWKLLRAILGLFKPISSLFLNDQTEKELRSVMLRVVSAAMKVYRVFRDVKHRIQSHRLLRHVQHGVHRLNSVIRRNRLVLLPWAITASGVSVQMGWVKNRRDMRRVVNKVMNPLNVILKKFSSRSLLRSLEAVLVKRIRASRDKTIEK